MWMLIMERYRFNGIYIVCAHVFCGPIRMLADRFNTLQMGMVGSSRVFKVLDTKESIVQQGDYQPNKIEGEINFKDVSFAYNDQNPVLKIFS